MKSKIFFNPSVGINYSYGINGHKVMVLGASHFCDIFGCQYHKQCTDEKIHDSSPYDDKCPNSDWKLSSQTVEDIRSFSNGTSSIVAYKTFSKFLAYEMGLFSSPEEVYSSVLFFNFVQYFIPRMKTEARDLCERDWEAFLEVYGKYQPDVVIVWGAPVGRFLKNKGRMDSKLKGADINYIFRIPDFCAEALFVNCYHPCDMYGHFSSDKKKFSEQLKIALL